MNDDKRSEANGPQAGKIEDIMRERDRLDKILQTKFRKRMAIVFTDVCGYTHFMDTRGDIAGRAWMQKHHDIVLPLITGHEGQVLSIMGDGVMASFESTLNAVKACIAIQKGLAAYNTQCDPADELHVTIGINTGEILVDEDHIAGDVVNVASRIESKAEKDQILVSSSAYDEVCGSEDIVCRLHGEVSVKGKTGALKLYRVVWQEEEIVVAAAPRVRSSDGPRERRVKRRPNVLQLEINREDDRLKISAFEQQAGEVSTVRRYEEIPVSMDKIAERCREIVETLNTTNRKGRLSRDVLVRLRDIGRIFSDELFTAGVKETIRDTRAEHLTVNLDDQLVQVPWELLHDGQQFLSQRFSMGRLVKTRQNVVGVKSRIIQRPMKMLVLADPKGDLQGAYDEGIEIRDFMDRQRDLVSVSLRSENITSDFIREKIRNFDLVHFAGHSDYHADAPGEGGWRLSDGTLKASALLKMAGTGSMPSLIFSNACQSARTEEWALKPHFQDEIFGLANAFILAGVKHYVGTFWEILDEPSRRFAIEFYRQVMDGCSVGDALRQARLKLIDVYGEETIVWGSYLLYGDPTYNYMDQLNDQEAPEAAAPELEPSVAVSAQTRAADRAPAVGAESVPAGKKPGRTWALVGGALAAVVLAVALYFSGVFKTDTTPYEQEIASLYSQGKFDEAFQASAALAQKVPAVRLSYLVQGDILLRQGKLEDARGAYEKALQATRGDDRQKARALVGLGRIASAQQATDQAMDFYRQAAEAAPGSGIGFLPQAMLLEGKGDASGALALLDQARQAAPDDRMLTLMAERARRKVAFESDQAQQARIDGLVKDLLATLDQPPRALPGDGWTSTPLTLWIMDPGTLGVSFQEGEDKLLVAALTEQLLQSGGVELVERALLDKLMGELKLGSSQLADRNTALNLGRLMAAKLMLSGKIAYAGPQTQVSLRLIETETGRIAAAVSDTFPSAATPNEMAERLASTLGAKIEAKYPLRAKVARAEGETLVLNLGTRAGAAEGQRFKALGGDSVLEVVAAQPDECVAKVVSGSREGLVGQRVTILK